MHIYLLSLRVRLVAPLDYVGVHTVSVLISVSVIIFFVFFFEQILQAFRECEHEHSSNEISPMPVPRYFLALVAIGHSRVGGAEDTSRASNRLSCYDVNS
ncbi:hypothetical protein LSAT2_006693 [Lamellibrachia satsuma]|nr:hypothetical protein LSAT2_006693 [Lamellibrachia satsuma]